MFGCVRFVETLDIYTVLFWYVNKHSFLRNLHVVLSLDSNIASGIYFAVNLTD